MAKAMVPGGEANKILIAAWGLDCVDLNDKCKETIRWLGILESVARCGEIPARQRWCVRWELEKQCCAWCGAVGASDIRKKDGGWRWLKGVKFAEFLWEPWETPMKIDTVSYCTYLYISIPLYRYHRPEYILRLHSSLRPEELSTRYQIPELVTFNSIW